MKKRRRLPGWIWSRCEGGCNFEDGMLDDLKEMQRSIDVLEQKTKMISEEQDRIAEENADLKRRLAELDSVDGE